MERSVNDLSTYRYYCCKEALEDAKIMFDAGRYKNCLNRAYYAVFYAIRAVNALDGFDSSKHSGVIAYFNKHYVKEGTFPKEASLIIKQASEQREKADYLDFFIASKEEAQKQIERASVLCGWVSDYLKQKRIISESPE